MTPRLADDGIRVQDLLKWLDVAKPGQTIVYAIIHGSVCPRDTETSVQTPDHVQETMRRAPRLYLDGEVALVQRRVGQMPSPGRIGRFDYLAIKRRHVRPQRNVWAKADWSHLQYSRPTSEPECVPA
jgi:hypothetical protein